MQDMRKEMTNYSHDNYILFCLDQWAHDWMFAYPDKYVGTDSKRFRDMTLNAWAAEMVLDEVRRRKDDYFLDVIRDMIDQSEEFYTKAKTKEAKEVFEVLHEVSLCALDYMICLFY